MTNQSAPSDEVAARVRAVRGKRGLKIDDLAARCAKIGFPALTRDALYKIEGSRAGKVRKARPVTVDELLALAIALNCPVESLLVPPTDPEQPYHVTPGVTESREDVRAWIRGALSLGPWDHPGEYASEVAAGEVYFVLGGPPVTQAPVRERPARKPKEPRS
jgi:transcriptional regulator with XRE-family HTH domain